MTLAIILFIMVLLGIVLFGYAFQVNRQRKKNDDDTIQPGRDAREGDPSKY